MANWEREVTQQVLSKFEIPRGTLEKVIQNMEEDFQNGLQSDSNTKSPIKMLLTYVRSIPNGTEHGDYFALDLGGTNFRVLYVGIKDGRVNMGHKTYPMEDYMKGTAQKLFGYIAECLVGFAKEKLGPNTKKISSVGFTFSFPVLQRSLTSGDLIKWTKGYDIDGVENHDIVQLLNDALKQRNDMMVDKIVLLNDTTGVMMSGAFDDNNVGIGLILGTGTNACYMEQLSNIPKWAGDSGNPKQVIINTEWGAFGEKGELDMVKTAYDKDLDARSLYPGQQVFEKMISGMYLGEVVRLALIDIIKAGALFQGKVSEKLKSDNGFETWYVSDMCGGVASDVVKIMNLVGYPDATLNECLVFQQVCHAASRRAAKLAAAGLATIIRRMDKPSMSVAIDGSLFKKHPLFKRMMQDTLEELVPKTQVTLTLADDGSGKGAALIAAVADRLDKESK